MKEKIQFNILLRAFLNELDTIKVELNTTKDIGFISDKIDKLHELIENEL